MILFWLLLIGSQSTDRLPQYVTENIQKRVENGINPSIAIGILDELGVQYYNFGTTHKQGPEVDEHTVYEIGSISKVFTGILLAQQVLEGQMSLNDPINRYLPPEAQVPNKGSQELTLGSLSDHTSGLPRMPANFTPANPFNPFADYTVEQLYSFIHNYVPVREVGAQYEYSNLAQGLLGHILASTTGTTYEELVVQNIAGPLELVETRITLDKVMQEHLATGHNAGSEAQNWDIPTLSGAGAIRSSTSDMLKFLSANLGFTNTPLKEAMELSHKVRHDQAGEMRVGLGWHIKKGAEGDVVWHNGGTGGYRAFAGFVKETGKAVVVLTNSTISVDDIGFHLLDPSSKLNPVRNPGNAISVPEDVLQSYVGTYQLTPDFNIVVTRVGGQLFGQATGQGKFELFAETPRKFYLTVVPAEITFQFDGDKVESLTLFQNGQQLAGKRLED